MLENEGRRLRVGESNDIKQFDGVVGPVQKFQNLNLSLDLVLLYWLEQFDDDLVVGSDVDSLKDL